MELNVFFIAYRETQRSIRLAKFDAGDMFGELNHLVYRVQ